MPVRPWVTVVVALALAGGCGNDQPAGGGDTVVPTPGMGPELVAVFEAAVDPDDLEALQERIFRAAPDHVAVAPAGCWEGLAGDMVISESAYVAAVVAEEEAELESAIEAVGSEPVHQGSYQVVACE